MTYIPNGVTKKVKVGSVLDIFQSKKRVDKLQLDKKGVIGDKFYNTDINRSVLLTSIDSYELAKRNGIKIEYGNLGENILLDFNPYKLPIDSKIQIGEAILAISQECTLCKSLSKIDTKLPKLLRNDRGIFAKVVKKGSVKVGDEIYIIND